MPQPKQSARKPRPPDQRWDILFWRFVQVVGLCMIIAEFVTSRISQESPRFEVLGVGLAFMLGARGIEKIVGAWRSGG